MASRNLSGFSTVNPFPPPDASNPEVKLVIMNTVNRLLDNIGLPIRVLGCQVKTDGNNTIILFATVSTNPLQYPVPPQLPCILRLSKERSSSPDYEDVTVKDIVAFHHVARETSDLIPRVYAYDATDDNCLGSPYIIQEWVQGEDMRVFYRGLDERNDTLHIRVRYAREIANFIHHRETQMSQYQSYGYFETDEKMALKSAAPFTITDHISHSVRPWTIGPSMDYGSKISNFVIELLASKVNEVREQEHEASYQTLVSIAHKLVDWDRTGTLVQQAEPAILWHPDFWPRNIMMSSDQSDAKLTGVIDWDGVIVLPRVMTRRPPDFLWNRGNLSLHESKSIQLSFDKSIEQLLPGYGIDAYHPMSQLTRALGMYALKGVDWMFWSELRIDEVEPLWLELVDTTVM